MPGLPLNQLRSDGKLFSSETHDGAFLPPRVLTSINVSKELKRLPLYNILACHCFNCSNIVLPSGRVSSNNQIHGGHISSQITRPVSHGSADSEHDLAAMVHDFMENGSYGSDFHDSSDGENGLNNGAKPLEMLQALKLNATPLEREIISILVKVSLSIKEMDLECLNPMSGCKGECVHRLLVKHMRVLGYNASICSSKWSNSGKVPGGKYEYIDVLVEEDVMASKPERLILDLDFQSQFEIARPTHSYANALKFLPTIFVGKIEKLKKVLHVMAEAAKLSLGQNSMPLPPWRTFEYMSSKWMSPFERILLATDSNNHRSGNNTKGYGSNARHRDRINSRPKQCVEKLMHLKICIATEAEKNELVVKDRNAVFVSHPAKTMKLSTSLLFTEKITTTTTTHVHFTKSSLSEEQELII